jgi:hypothetical protein
LFSFDIKQQNKQSRLSMTNNTIAFTQSAIDKLNDRKYAAPLTIKQIEYVLAQKKDTLIEAGIKRFTGLNAKHCTTYLEDDKVWDIIKEVVEGLQPAENSDSTNKRGRKPKNKSTTPKDATTSSSTTTPTRYSDVPAVIDTKVVMLLNGSKCGRGKIIGLQQHGRVTVECECVTAGFNNRIPPNNGEKTLEPGEQFTFNLKDLVLDHEWKDATPKPRTNDSNVITERANSVLARINAPTSTSSSASSNKRKRSTEEDTSSEESDEEDNRDNVPLRKKAKSVPVETYDDLHHRFIESQATNENLQAQVLQLKHEVSRLTTKLAKHERLQADITKLYRHSSAIDKPTEEDERLKPLKIFNFKGKEYNMEYDEYQKYKHKKQRNVVLTRLMQLFEIPAHLHCLPGDRRSKRQRLPEETIQEIVDQAMRNFTVFKADSYDNVKSNIGDVCSAAASTYRPLTESDQPDEQHVTSDSGESETGEPDGIAT